MKTPPDPLTVRKRRGLGYMVVLIHLKLNHPLPRLRAHEQELQSLLHLGHAFKDVIDFHLKTPVLPA